MADFVSINPALSVDLAREPDFRLGALQVCPSTCQVIWGENSIDLQPQIMKVLVTLARAQGRTVSVEDLVAVCWGGGVVGDDSVHRCIARLRRLAQVEAPGNFSIVTQARVGYRLVEESADLEPNVDVPAANLKGATREAAPRGPKRWRGWPFAVAAILALGLAVILAAAYWPSPAVYRIAVRDFKVDGLDARIGQSLADRITAAVSDRELPVVTRTRSGRGDFDGARYIVGGDVQRLGDTIKVDIQLDDAASGLTLWTDTITRSLSESDALQDQVAGKVADLMDLTRNWLGPHAEKAKPEAVVALLKATDTIRNEERGMLQTREAFRQFRDLDPASSEGHSGYAMATALAAYAQPPEVARQWRAEAAAEARRAMDLDPKNGEAYMALGVLAPAKDFAQGEAWFLKGLSVDRDNASLANFLGCELLEVGRVDEALVWIDRSVKADPLSPPKTESMIQALAVDGRFSEAEGLIVRAARLWPDKIQVRRSILFATLIYASPERAFAALEQFQRADQPLPPDDAELWRLFERARVGQSPAAGIEKRFAAAPVSTVDSDEMDARIDALALLGDADGAFHIIGARHAAGHGFDPSVLFEPATRSLRTDPRFTAVAADFGLVRYWTQTRRKPDFCGREPVASLCS